MTGLSRMLCEIDHSAIAGYLQFVGSIIAIGVAIWVPYDLDRRAKKRQKKIDRQNARRTQASLLPLLYELRSKLSDFIEESSGEPSFLGIEREPDDFDSDFFALVPMFKSVLASSPDAGKLQSDLNELSVRLFKAKEMLDENGKLQRDGYRAAWINHHETFVDEAQLILKHTGSIISKIEAHEA